MSENRVLILGASGRLARQITLSLGVNWEVIGVGRDDRSRLPREVRYFSRFDSEAIAYLRLWRPNVVLNLAATWRGAANRDIWKSSFEFPTLVAATLRRISTLWVQVDSYYNIYHELYGVDKDFYSQTKRVFFESLQAQDQGFKKVQILAPHLVGKNEPEGRLFQALVSGLSSWRVVELSSGDQFVPYVHLADAAAQIVGILEKARISGLTVERIQLQRLDCQTPREIARQVAALLGADPNLLRFGQVPEREREFCSPVPLDGIEKWLAEPMMTLREIVNDLLVEV